MSLVISSNDTLGNKQFDRYSTNQAPYRFTNHLVSPLEIDADSEVAVHSFKCNKDGLVKLSPSLSWYQFFNVDPRITREGEDPAIDSVDNSTGWEIKCFPKMDSTKRDEYVSLYEFADRFQSGMRRGIPHPDFVSILNPKTKMDILRDSGTTGAGFQGFQLTYQYSGLDAVGSPSRYERLFPNDGTTRITHTPATETFKALVGKQSGTNYDHAESQKNCIFGMNHPISHTGGECIFDLREAGEKVFHDGDYHYTKLNKDFVIGLNRAVPMTNGLFLNRQAGYNEGGGSFSEYNLNPFDYAVSCEQIGGSGNRWLKVGHLVQDSIMFDDQNPLAMEDIQYFKGTGAGEWTSSNFGTAGAPTNAADDIGRYNMSVNASRFDGVKFSVENEIVSITLIRQYSVMPSPESDPSHYPEDLLVCSYSMRSTHASGFGKHVFPKPAGQTCWNLYPKLVLPFKDTEIILDTFDGKNTGFDADAPTQPADWYQRSLVNGEFEGIMAVDRRYYNDMTDLTMYPQKGVVESGEDYALAGYIMNVILTPQNITYPHTQGANAQYILGFVERGVLDSNNVDFTEEEKKYVYQSDAAPSIQAKDSMFIRLDNFTQKSFNAGTGRPSKIIHHVPRFDTSNREIGAGLYFEPHEKTYIKLNNSNPIVINELDFSICNSREQMITDLTGETIICLHFRKAK